MTTSDTQILLSISPGRSSPVGAVVNSSGQLAGVNPWNFSTKYFDQETGLGYWGMRWYSTEISRWLSRDPIEEEGGENLYGFAGNSTVNNVDADGRHTLTPVDYVVDAVMDSVEWSFYHHWRHATAPTPSYGVIKYVLEGTWDYSVARIELDLWLTHSCTPGTTGTDVSSVRDYGSYGHPLSLVVGHAALWQNWTCESNCKKKRTRIYTRDLYDFGFWLGLVLPSGNNYWWEIDHPL